MIELADDVTVRAHAKAGIGLTPRTIENEASGSFEKPFALLVTAKIDDATDLEAGAFEQRRHTFDIALQAPSGGRHRIKDDRSILVEGYPVVAKNCVRLRGHCGVFEDECVHTRLAETFSQAL